MNNIESDATALKTMGLRRETRKQALTYMRALRKSAPRKKLPDKAVYYCAFIASEQLQNADALPYKVQERGIVSGRTFWGEVETIQSLLSQASDRSIGSADQGSFTYTRLPEYKPPCELCKSKGLPCLKSRRTSERETKGTYKCQLCYSRKMACKRDAETPSHDDGEESDGEEYLDPASLTRVPTGGAEEPIELALRSEAILAQSTSEGDTSLIQRPKSSASPRTRYPTAPSPSTLMTVFPSRVPQQGGSSKSQSPRQVRLDTAKHYDGPRQSHALGFVNIFGHQPTEPSPFSAPSDMAQQPYYHPGCSSTTSASSSSEPPAHSDQEAQYVVVAYAKALEVIKHVREHGSRLEVKLREAVIDMEQALKPLDGPEPLQERLTKLGRDDFQMKKDLVRYACEEVTDFVLPSDIQDVKLQVLLPALKRRIAQLSDA